VKVNQRSKIIKNYISNRFLMDIVQICFFNSLFQQQEFKLIEFFVAVYYFKSILKSLNEEF